MKILNRANQETDLTRILLRLRKDYKTLYTYQFEDEVFIYRPIGRKEYRDIFINDRIDDATKEEAIIRRTMILPIVMRPVCRRHWQRRSLKIRTCPRNAGNGSGIISGRICMTWTTR